jgi:hypothetical protein
LMFAVPDRAMDIVRAELLMCHYSIVTSGRADWKYDYSCLSNLLHISEEAMFTST